MDQQNKPSQEQMISEQQGKDKELALAKQQLQSNCTFKQHANLDYIHHNFLKLGLLNINRKSSEQSATSWKLQRLNDQQNKQIGKCLDDIQAINVDNIQILSCNFYTILDHLHKIRLDHVKQLSLYDNNIVSIEQLQNVTLRTLVNLRLDNNHITNLKSFKKFDFPALQQLDLQNNGFNQPQHLYQLNAPNLLVLRLEDWTVLYPTNDHKAWLTKLQSTVLNYLRCPNPRRMKQPRVDSMLLKKYAKLNIMRHNGT